MKKKKKVKNPCLNGHDFMEYTPGIFCEKCGKQLPTKIKPVISLLRK